jgi:hypothetical protein
MRRRPHRADGSLPLKVRHRTLGPTFGASLRRPWHLLGLFRSGMLPPHPIDLKRDCI